MVRCAAKRQQAENTRYVDERYVARDYALLLRARCEQYHYCFDITRDYAHMRHTDTMPPAIHYRRYADAAAATLSYILRAAARYAMMPPCAADAATSRCLPPF